MERLTGIVDSFSAGRGYGFIKHDGKRIFVHFSNIKDDGNSGGQRNLHKGQKVSFIIIEGYKGKSQAGDVEVID